MTDALTLPRSETQAATSAKRTWLREHLPIASILAAQASYTIRLIPVGYLSTDEARYIVAGHVLIHELFHGGGSPFYETFFSGAPDIYSPLAAMADYVGGVVAVRLMSMCFMLIATYLLYRTAERLVGYLAAVCSAGLFAGLGITQVVGRNTIYDAMAFMLMAAAAYCAARSRDGQAKWLLLVPLALFAAYFTKYMTFLFDPVVIAIASFGVGSWKESARRLVILGLHDLEHPGSWGVSCGVGLSEGHVLHRVQPRRRHECGAWRAEAIGSRDHLAHLDVDGPAAGAQPDWRRRCLDWAQELRTGPCRLRAGRVPGVCGSVASARRRVDAPSRRPSRIVRRDPCWLRSGTARQSDAPDRVLEARPGR